MIPILLYFALFYHYAVNMPKWDDYIFDDLLNNLRAKLTFLEWLKILASTHMEHRIALVRLIFLSQYLIFGKLNFILLSFIGQLGLISILVLILKIAHNYKIRFKYLVPIPYILFSLSQYELLTWSMASIQQYYQLFFSLLCIYTAINCQNKFSIINSFIFSFIATFTGGGGLLCYPVVTLYYLVYGNIRKLILWLSLSILTFVLYFKILDYQTIQLTHKWQNDALHHINGLIEYFLSIVGSFIFANSYFDIILKTLIGLLIVSLIGFSILKKSYNKYKDISFIIIFLLLSCAIISFNRFNLELHCISRYTIYSLLLLCMTYLLYLKEFNFKNLNFKLFSVISYSIFIYWIIASSSDLRYQKYVLNTSINNPNTIIGYNAICNSLKYNYFPIPQSIIAIFPENIPLNNRSLYKNNFVGSLDEIDWTEKELIVRGWALCPKPYHIAKTVILKINDNYFPSNYGAEERKDVEDIFCSRRYRNSGFSITLFKSSLPARPWKISVIVVDQNNSALYESPVKIIN